MGEILTISMIDNFWVAMDLNFPIYIIQLIADSIQLLQEEDKTVFDSFTLVVNGRHRSDSGCKQFNTIIPIRTWFEKWNETASIWEKWEELKKKRKERKKVFFLCKDSFVWNWFKYHHHRQSFIHWVLCVAS